MGILDKLKPTPRWKHADASIRLEAVREVDDASVLALLAETDADPKVRRAALARLDDAGVLARMAAQDPDQDTKDRAADRLLDFALDPAVSEAVALQAVRGISDTRRLSAAAKSAPLAPVRQDALARLTDENAIGAVASHAKDETLAHAALARLKDADKILDVALNSEHREIALAAFDRLVTTDAPDVALLATIETRTQHKPVAKRARAILQQLEDAEAARKAAEEERRARHTSLSEAAENLTALDWQLAEVELARLNGVWASQLDVAPETSARYARAADLAQAGIAAGRKSAEEAAEKARAQAEALATRVALCSRVETLDGDDIPAQLSAIDAEWQSLAPLVGSGPEADRLDRVFASAAAACRNRHEQGAKLAETRAALAALVDQAEALPALEDAGAAAARWQALAREARGLAATLSSAGRPADDLEARITAVDATFAERDARIREAAAKAQQDQLVKLQRMTERTARASEADAITLREGERLMRDLRVVFDDLPRDGGKDFNDEAAKLRALQEKIAPRVRELREMDDWRRFANAQQQEQLILQAETLVATLASEDQAGKESDLAAAARALRDFHLKWKDVSEAPRDQAQKLWERFRTATDLIRLRCEGYFKKLKEERTVNNARRSAIVEETEKLCASGEWAKTAERLQQLQTEWNALGPASREQGRELAHRFRTATNEFFTKRREEVTERKKTWSDNLARKEALVARAEELATSTQWETAVPELKRLQADWKTIGPVRRAKSDEVWVKFRAAADKLFERYHNRHQLALESKLAEREAMVVALESLASAAPDADAAGVVDRVQELRTTWNRSVPIPSNEFKALADRWQVAFAKTIERWADAFKGSEFDPATTLQRMEKLITRVETVEKESGGSTQESKRELTPTEQMAARLRSALASNAMGGRTSDDSKWRQAGDVVKDAQSAWLRLAPVPGDQARALEAKFQKVCRRVMDQVRAHSHSAPPPAGPPSGGRRPEPRRQDPKRSDAPRRDKEQPTTV